MGESTQLSSEQRDTLAVISRLKTAKHFYLAGGTGVAAHLNHRTSVDLDIFSTSGQLEIDRFVDEILAAIPEAVVVSRTDATTTLRVGDLAVDIVRYEYALLTPPVMGPEGFALANLIDLAAMKLSAITNRGIYRDFWDLHEIVTASEITLHNVLDAFSARFGVRKSDRYHVLKALIYFEDAEAPHQVMPRGLSELHWDKIKRYFRAETPAILKSFDLAD